MTVYFVRHGQTLLNIEDKVCGLVDCPLTELGHQQAIEIGKKIKKSELKIDIILYSPLSRAKDTAKHISEICGIKMIEEPRLIEQAFGEYEGTPKNCEAFMNAKKQFLSRYDGGESMFQVAQRIYNLLDDLKKENKTYLLVAHNGISRVVNSYFYPMTIDEYAAFQIKNCEIKEYHF